MGDLNGFDRRPPSPARRALLMLPVWAAVIGIRAWGAFIDKHATEGWLYIAAGIAFPAAGYALRRIRGLPATVRGNLLLALAAGFVIALAYADGHPWPGITVAVFLGVFTVWYRLRTRR